MFGWLHVIYSKKDYDILWNFITKHREIYLGNFLIIEGALSCTDGRIIGKEGEIVAAIITITFNRESMEKFINSGIIDDSKTVLISDLAPSELIKTKEGANLIKKKKKDFEKPSGFKNYLRKIQYKDFKEED